MRVTIEILMLEVENILTQLRDLPCYTKMLAFEQIQNKFINEFNGLAAEVKSHSHVVDDNIADKIEYMNNFEKLHSFEFSTQSNYLCNINKKNIQTIWKLSFIASLCHKYTLWRNSYKNSFEKDNCEISGNEYYSRNTTKKTCEIKCDECDKTFTRRTSYNIHMKRHYCKRSFECGECGSRFNVRGDLIIHLRTHIRKLGFKCNICLKMFVNKTTLKNHVAVIHQKSHKFYCNKCNYFAYLARTLKEHIKIKHSHKNKKYACVICNRVLENRALLKVHLRSHTGEKPYKCDICDADFMSSGILTNHKKCVHGDRIFTCDVCPKSFSAIHALRRHSLIHNEVKPFLCSFCKNYSASTHGNLTRHVRTIHQVTNFSYSKYEKLVNDRDHQISEDWIKNAHIFTEQYMQDLNSRTGSGLTIDQLKHRYTIKLKDKKSATSAKNNLLHENTE